jgi:DNA replication protein DnaC
MALTSGLKIYPESFKWLSRGDWVALKRRYIQRREKGLLSRRCKFYARPDILVIDEVGYMQLSRQQAELLFQIVCARYERGTIIMTSNKYFSDWGELMSDSVIATAILDRLLYHAHVINIRGESYRLERSSACRLESGRPPARPWENRL